MSSHLIRLLYPRKILRGPYASSVKQFIGIQGCQLKPAAGNAPSAISMSTTIQEENKEPSVNNPKVLSKAMVKYLEQAEAYDAFLTREKLEYEIGKRHLANIMGYKPDMFTDRDRDNAIAYLFPSGLSEKRARPKLKHPIQVFPKRKEAQFDKAGRPHHFLFYTGYPNYYGLLHDISNIMDSLQRKSQDMDNNKDDKDDSKIEKFDLYIKSSKWINRSGLGKKIGEDISESQYELIIDAMNRLVDHPMSITEEKFIATYRKPLGAARGTGNIPEPVEKDGVSYMTSVGSRKTSKAKVTVVNNGTGKITINGEDILYFSNLQDREQVIFPLKFTGLLGKVDVNAEVKGGGTTGQSGAIRYGLSKSLRSFVTLEMVEKMRQAGLLTRDPRNRERKKPGQKGARAKFTWKKR